MTTPFVESHGAVTLLGGAPFETRCLQEAMALAPTLVCADGGASGALAAGQVPAAVIGDMDSVSEAVRARLDPATLFTIREQNTTDFEKALSQIAAPLILAVGFTGARLDHELAVYNAIVRSARPVVVVGEADIAFHAPRRMALDLPAGTRVSFFPLGQVTGTSQGLDWPIDGLVFAPDGRVGTSNRSSGGRVAWTFDRSGMLAILPRACLAPVAEALVSAEARAG